MTVYKPETILDIEDKKRAADLIKRGLCTEYKNEDTDTFVQDNATTGVNEESHAEDMPEAPAEKETDTPADGASATFVEDKVTDPKKSNKSKTETTK